MTTLRFAICDLRLRHCDIANATLRLRFTIRDCDGDSRFATATTTTTTTTYDDDDDDDNIATEIATLRL